VRRQWGELLGGRQRTEDGCLSFEWPDSLLRLSVRLDAATGDGPEAIELRCRRRLILAPDDRFGARFEQVG
jgi:hypothetical protein